MKTLAMLTRRWRTPIEGHLSQMPAVVPLGPRQVHGGTETWQGPHGVTAISLVRLMERLVG